jgi:hypothetical protein
VAVSAIAAAVAVSATAAAVAVSAAAASAAAAAATLTAATLTAGQWCHHDFFVLKTTIPSLTHVQEH